MNNKPVGQQFFWVNHKQTFKIARKEGFIWAPSRAKDGKPKPAYNTLQLVNPGDVIFSYAFTKIGAVGVAKSKYYDAIQPPAFDSFWDNQGWKVDVEFTTLNTPIFPKQHLGEIAPLLPKTHSPIKSNNGNGNEMYLSKISVELGHLLLKLCNLASLIQQNDTFDYQEIEKDIAEIKAHKLGDPTITERLIQARVGQGLFRQNVLTLYPQCPVTGVSMPELLRASHIKPWRDSSNEERLDPYNGLMLAPHVDVLFDHKLISFTDDGNIVIKDDPKIHEVAHILNIPTDIKIHIYEEAKVYLAWHREKLLRYSK
ncbi:HNH endonuclease [Yersinia massiliensis]|uniref:HNH endonuclease n=1 Tax=Yersinia massiliensis TaxID=419257 RepID=UPI001CFCEC55|nr:HNH endonuclease [Yersinia massiliensis]MCB5308573.1 HNH endonuclease [Yersinia massiliensis]